MRPVPRIAIIGSYTGRNAGDAAILENVVRDIAEACPDAQCEVLTINPRFIRETYPGLPLEPVATLPWNLSVKSFGLPALLAALRCDAVIVTSAILFDRQFWNPLYNYLTTLLLALPLAKRLGKIVYFYSVGVGPVYTPRGERIVRYLVDLADGISLREEASVPIMRELGIQAKPVMAADPALNQRLEPERSERMRQVIENAVGPGPRVAINLNAYIDDWTGKEGGGTLGEERFCREIAGAVRAMIDDWGWSAVLICTHYMDEPIMRRAAAEIGRPGKVLLLPNRDYCHRDLMAAMGLSEFMIGMRLHCQILAVAAGVPCVALDYAPKVRHFMEMIGLDPFVVDLGPGFSADGLLAKAEAMRDARDALRAPLRERVAELQRQAKRSAETLAGLLAQRKPRA